MAPMPAGPMPSPYAQMPMQPAPPMQPHYGQAMGHPPAAPAYYPQPMPANHMPANPMPANPMDAIAADIARRQQMLNANSASRPMPAAPGPAPAPATAAPAPAADEAVVHQLAELKRELAAVRSQVSKPIAVPQSVPQQEIDRIAKSIADLQSHGDANDATFEHLSKELAQLRSAMKGDVRSALQKGLQASGESQTDGLSKQLDQLGKDVRSAIRSEIKGSGKSQTSDLERRFEQLSQSIDQISLQSANAVVPQVDNLSTQLDSLRMTIDDLPQTLAISRIEDRMGELADKVAQLNQEVAAAPQANESPHVTAEEFVTIEKRLDEIARALVAVSNTGRNAPEVDMSAVERVEARMVDLARTLDSVAEQGDQENLDKLSVRIEGLTERLASFEKYAESGDLGGASALFAAPDTGVIEDQLRALNSRIEEVVAQPGTATLEEQIQHLSQRVEEASAQHSSSEQISSLESQIALILQQMDGMGGPAAASVDFTPVEARLGQIEHQLQSNQNFSLEAAQQAAQHAVSMMGPQSEVGGVIEALAHDLKSLQLLAEGNAAQSNQSVQQVQQTLQQVVDRLGVIEGALEEDAVRQATILPAEPVAAHGLAMPATATPPEQLANVQQDSGAAASSDGLVDAAIADENLGIVHKTAVDPIAEFEEQGDAATVKPVEAKPSAPSAPENLPLEPGSAAPNIDEMVQRASEQLNATHSKLAASADKIDLADKPGDERTSGDMRPDAVAAARRALQATTAEMAAVRDEAGNSSEKSLSKVSQLSLLKSFKDFDSSKLRKPLVLGAAALLLAIVTFKGIGIFTGSSNRPVAKLDAPAVEMSADSKKIGEAAKDGSAASKSVRTVGQSGANAPASAAKPAMDPAAKTKVETAVEKAATSPAQPVNVPMAATEPQVSTDLQAPAVGENAPATVPEIASTPQQATPKSVYDVPATAGPAALVAAASSGDPKALFQLGMRYSDGNDVKRNMTESAKWFQHAADAGFAPAQYSLGSLYEKGIGVERNIAKASGWYEKAAVQGNARAMHNLAVIYAMGNPPVVQPNMDTAVVWFKKAAQLGIKDSQFNLGILYGQGMGVPQNLVDSYKWFALAAKTGDNDANKKRDEVANAMDPDDLDFARKEVNNWAPSKLNEAVNRVAVPEEWRGRTSSGRSAQRAAPQNASVKKAQTMLNDRGFNVGEPDGLIGPKTKQAIMEFQKDAGIPITGKVDNKTLQALEL
ncbi:MAG: peptidoglycan-binding protein [Rhizobiaceae bacterium]